MLGKALFAMLACFALGGQAQAYDWVNGMKPGARYSFHQPLQSDLGAFHGIALEVLLVDWAAPGDNVAEGFGRLYFTMDFLYSTRGAGLLQSYAGGLAMSLERNPMRDFLIPFLAIEVGGLSHSRTGNEFTTQPNLGFYIFARRRLTLDMAVGYLLTPGNFRELNGVRARAGLTVSFW